jgi:hypothetical protein
VSVVAISVRGAEDMPKKPFGQDAIIPDPHQWILTPLYQYTVFEKVWVGKDKRYIVYPENHGFDQNDFALLTEYGIKKYWAADLLFGFTDLATRSYSVPPGSVRHTRGLMDTTFGIRYEMWNELQPKNWWTPTFTLRAGGIYRGTYQKSFPYAPGSGGVGLEISGMLQKHIGWEGFGVYTTAGYRDIRSGANSQFFTTVGFNQVFRGATLSAGYRHQQNTAGRDATSTGDVLTGNTIDYSSYDREENDQIETGIGYTDKRDRHWQFYYQGNFAGRNTGDKDRLGVYVSFPLGGKKTRD